MQPIHRLGRKRWWQKLKYPRRNVPLTERGETQESGYPWRIGQCRVFRLPFSKHAIAIGKWTGFQPRETVEGQPTLKFRAIEHWEDVVHVEPQESGSSAGSDLRF